MTEMAEAAVALLESLDPGRRSRAELPFDEDERRTWHYTPVPRRGVPLADLDRGQAKAVHRLLGLGLRPGAHAQVATIMGLEDVLDTLEGGGLGRHAGDYWTAVFGRPGDGSWGWRFEGHHVSVNYTFAGDGVATTPLFLGANPARVGAIRPLRREEELARALLTSMDARTRAKAVVSDDAPPDILTGERPQVEGELEPKGVAGAELGRDASGLLRRLVTIYVERLPEEFSGPRIAVLDDLGNLHFAWAGSPEPGGPHYYRIQGPRFLVELDNTQNDANHVHTVWRDPDGDFGEDLLRAHRQAHH